MKQLKSKSKPELMPADKAGVEAIIFLQSLAGIKETEVRALVGWRGLSKHEQAGTIALHKRLTANKG